MITGLLTILQCMAIAAVLMAILRHRIRLPFFAAFLFFDLFQIGVAYLASSETRMSGLVQAWAWCQLGLAAGYIAIAGEARLRILRQYPGIGTVATVFVGGAVALSSALIWVSAVDAQAGTAFLRLAIWLPRVVASILAVGMALLSLVLMKYPAKLSRNDLNHGKILMGYLAGRSITLLAVGIGAAPQLSALTGMLLSTCCFFAWAVLLSAEEPAPVLGDSSSAGLLLARERSGRAVEELKGYVN